MNAIFSYRRDPQVGGLALRGTVLAILLAMVLGTAGFQPARSEQSTEDTGAAFKRLAAELSRLRLNGLQESEPRQEQALALLDAVVTPILNASPSPDLDAGNRRLAGMVAHDPPLGENYRLVLLGANPVYYALVVNFGQGGPAAVRLYARSNGRYTLSARIDRFTSTDFFDSDIELVPVNAQEPVFVVVSGRTDDLSTGLFSVWRFDDAGLKPLWTSELLSHSSYQTSPNGFALTYCAESPDDRPLQCTKMARDLYRLQGSAWTRVESIDPGPPPTTKPNN